MRQRVEKLILGGPANGQRLRGTAHNFISRSLQSRRV
jgi:hypothetical protein